MATSATSVHAEPFQASVFVLFMPGGYERPEKTKASVALPEEPKLCLAVFISETSVQLVPSQVSTLFKEVLPSLPPAYIADVTNPDPML